jgi:hypothetical protein
MMRLVSIACICALMLLGRAAWADRDWETNGMPRPTAPLELGAYGGAAIGASGSAQNGAEVGGDLDVCILCVWTNHRLAWGDYQYLRFGVGGGSVAEGAQIGYGLTSDIDLVGRVFYQWGGFGFATATPMVGAAARYSFLTAEIAAGPGTAGSDSYFRINAGLRFALGPFALHGFVENLSGPSGVTSLRLAVAFVLF